MTRLFVLALAALMTLPASARPVVYDCFLYTRLPGAEESPLFRFTVDGAEATLTYNLRLRPTDEPQHKQLDLEVLNNSERSLVLGFLTEGTEENAPRYDVWVLDKDKMLLSAETTRATDAHIGRREQRSGVCITNR